MKKSLMILIVTTTLALSSMPSMAEPNFDREDEPRTSWQGRPDGDHRMRERQIRQERGVERLKQHRWQAGYVMPQHYRGNGYKVDYKDNHLPRPERNQQWYKINNDYILVDADDHSIVRIMGF